MGYQPVIITLPEGTNMMATAVISADRRYVRITPSPMFSGISEVNTFNTATGQGGGGGAGGGTGGRGYSQQGFGNQGNNAFQQNQQGQNNNQGGNFNQGGNLGGGGGQGGGFF